MDIFILIFLSLVVGFNTGLAFHLSNKIEEQRKIIDSIIQSLLDQKTTFDLSSKLTLEYLSRLERDISFLSSIPPSTTIN